VNGIFFAIVAIAFAIAGYRQVVWSPDSLDENTPMEVLSLAMVDSASGAVTLAIGLVGVMALFLGLMKVAEAGGLWLHVDAAFAGALILSERLRSRLAGIEKADSLAFDLHKWMHVPYDAGCVLVRDAAAHRATFSADRDYLSRFERGPGSGDPWFTDYGPELSRGFRALKVWISLRSHGLDRLGRMVEKNCAQATWLADRIEDSKSFRLAAPASLNIVCFRAVAPAEIPIESDELNREIVMRVQESGVAVPSSAEIDGHLCIRVAITNHRTRREDLALLLDALERAREAVLAAG